MKRMQFDAAVEVAAGAGAGDDATPWVNPGAMTPAERMALVRRIEGREVYGLRFRARAFGTGENANRAYLTPEQVAELAETAAGVDLLADHGFSVSGVVGEVIGGQARDEGGERVLVLDHELTEPGAMIAFAQRRLRRFSVAIDAEDWREDERGDLWAQGAVRLVHNAFVSDPAYGRAEVIQPFQVRKMEDQQQAAPDHAAKIAELEAALSGALAKITDLQSKLDARESAAFDAAFNNAAAQGRVLPAARAQFDAVRKATGLDSALSLLGALAPQAALPVQPVGQGDPTPPTTPKPAEAFSAKEAADIILRASGRVIKKEANQ